MDATEIGHLGDTLEYAGIDPYKTLEDQLRRVWAARSFERYLKLSSKCAKGRANYESPRYAAIAVAQQPGNEQYATPESTYRASEMELTIPGVDLRQQCAKT